MPAFTHQFQMMDYGYAFHTFVSSASVMFVDYL